MVEDIQKLKNLLQREVTCEYDDDALLCEANEKLQGILQKATSNNSAAVEDIRQFAAVDESKKRKLLLYSLNFVDRTVWVEKFDPENCRICLKSTHPTVSYFVIKCERQETAKYNIKPYKWLTKKEAEAIVEYAAVSDVVDLRKLGDYLIHCQKQIQSVIIMNDVDDFTDEERPILVKQVSDTKD